MRTYTLGEYAVVLGTVEPRVTSQVRGVIVHGALNIRDDWRKRAKAANPKHAPKYASTITMRRAVIVNGEITAIVEPGAIGQGKLGQVLEYGHGAAHNRPQLSHVAALAVEAPKLAEFLAKVSADAIR